MRSRETWAGIGLWLTCGGLVILAVERLLAVYGPQLSIDDLALLGGAIAGYLAIAVGVWLSLGRRVRGRSASAGADLAPASSQSAAASKRGGSASRAVRSFLTWCDEDYPEANPWNPFDQLIREMITELLGGVRVRCYQVLPGDQQLRSLSRLDRPDDGECARSGILGHVATTGCEFVAGDPAHGELVHQRAKSTDEVWDWICPIRQGNRTVGLVAVGRLSPDAGFDRERRQELSVLITTFWRHVACLERLGIAERTDKISGLLTRGDFLEVATHALADSHAENEPVAVVVLALEGLRRLDDVGRWQDRDALVESIGLLAKQRIRTDDVIGRFSDDRFVLLLRRLDSGLGRLIAGKIQSMAQQRMSQAEDLGAMLRARVGLTGSGFSKQPLQKLLAAAFDAAEMARKQDAAIYCDLDEPGSCDVARKPPTTESPATPAPGTVPRSEAKGQSPGSPVNS